MYGPHTLTGQNWLARVSACDPLLKRNKKVRFLKRLITGDEKWILYHNIKRKRSRTKLDKPPKTTSKGGLHPKNVMLSVKGIIYYELLPTNETISAEKYC